LQTSNPKLALPQLRRLTAAIDPLGGQTDASAVTIGLPAIDAALGGGLAMGAVHELAPPAPIHFGAAAGFAAALAVMAGQRGRQTVWVQHDYSGCEAGEPYGPGLDQFGLASANLLCVRVPRAIDVLWATEEALKCHAVAAVITELANEGEAADLTATRRLALAARDGGVVGLMLRHRPSAAPSASATRWEVAAEPGMRDRFGGLGRPSFTLSLVRNRRGPIGQWTIAWNHHEHAFVPAAISGGVAQVAGDGSDRARRLARAG
jgi:protein ImuA